MAHFGYTPVEPDEKARRVHRVFDSVAYRYDLMNDLMSFGVHRYWKRAFLWLAHPRPGQRWLDLACGTGDLARLLRPRLGAEGSVVMCDFNAAMLEIGRDRMLDSGTAGVAAIQADGCALPFPSGSFDRVVIAFGLRNVARPADCLREMYRVLRPGGEALVLEFSRPQPWLAPLYKAYTHRVLPRLGEAVAGDREGYRYLAESIEMHPDQTTLREMMRLAGFARCRYCNLSAGIVAVHRGARCD